MRTKLLRLAIVALFIPLLIACQTKSGASYSEVKDATKPVDDLRVKLLIEFCRGQTPQAITSEAYDTWPPDAKAYATNNVAQWLAAGCNL